MLQLGELNVILDGEDKPLRGKLDGARKISKEAGHDAGRGFSAGLGTAAMAGAGVVGAAVGVAFAEALNMDRAQAKFEAQLGDAEFAEDLGEVAGRLYTTGLGQSMEENMAAVRAVMSAGLVPEDATDQAIEQTTRLAESLAEVFDQDVTQAARAAGKMVQTGLAGDATQAFDILTRGFQQTGDMADDLLDTFSEYSTQFREAGIDGQKAMGLIAQAVKAGARDTDVAADAIKEFADRGKSGASDAAAAYKALGLNAKQMFADVAAGGPSADAAMTAVLARLKEMKDPVEQNAIATALFGEKAIDLGDALYAFDPSTAVDALGDVEGASNKMADALGGSASAKLNGLKRELQSALVEKLGQAIPYVEKMVGFLREHKDVVGPVATGFGVLAVAIGLVAAAQMAWNMALMISPVGWVIIAVVALVAAFIYLWNHCEGFRNFWIGLWDAIVTVAKTWWEVFSAFWTTIGGWFVALFQGWWSLFTGFWSGVFDAVGAAWDWIVGKWNAMVSFVTGLPGRISAAARGMWDGVKDAFRAAINFIVRGWNSLSFRIPSVDTHIPGVGRVGGMTLSVPHIPYLASGGTALEAGLAVVAERGPEEIFLPRGAQVRPLDRSERGGDPGRPARVDGEIRIRGDGILAGLRETIAVRGGNVQAVLGG